MADSKKPTPGKPIADVAHPGQSAPSTSSRPVIVTNRPLLKDPMVVAEDTETEVKTIEAEAKKTDKAATITAPDQPKIEPPETHVTESSEKLEKDEAETKPDETVAKDEPKDSTVESTPDPTAEIEAEAKKQAEHDDTIQKLVDSKQYFLPINTVEKRRSKRFVALGMLVSLLLIMAWVDIAADSGILTVAAGLPHTHLFSNKTTTSTATTTVPAIATLKGYTTANTKLRFRYPSDWQFSDKGTTTTTDNVSLNPKGSGDITTDVATGAIAVTFSNIPSEGSGAFTVKAVHYQRLTHKIHDTVYLRDLIYADKAGIINVTSSLGNSGSGVAVGDTLKTIDQSFLNVSGQNSSQFVISVIRNSSSGVGFSSVEEAQKFLKSSSYQQTRSILLSLVVPAH